MPAAASLGPPEVLDQDRAPRRRRWLWPAVAVAALVALGAGWADPRLQASEAAGLLEEAAAVRTAADVVEGQVAAMAAYAGPALTSATVPADLRADLGGLVSRPAAQALPQLVQRRDRIAAWRLLPWHSRLAAARDATLAYLDVRISDLAAIAADPSARSRPDPRAAALRAAALRAWQAAVADLAGGLAQRAADAFAADPRGARS